MDITASEWSQGCESGWTVYLEDSYVPITDNYHQSCYRLNPTRNNNENNTEEDLSMVSDASSGPPHFLQEDDKQSYARKSSKKSVKRSKKLSKEHKKVASKQQYHLDDTASSPVITHSKIYDNSSTMDFSENISETHYQGNSSYSNQYGAYWQSSHLKDDTDHSASGRLRRRWE